MGKPSGETDQVVFGFSVRVVMERDRRVSFIVRQESPWVMLVPEELYAEAGAEEEAAAFFDDARNSVKGAVRRWEHWLRDSLSFDTAMF